MLRMVSLGSYSCSAVSVPSPVKGDALSPNTEEALLHKQMGNYSGPFLERRSRYSSVISFCIKENHDSDC